MEVSIAGYKVNKSETKKIDQKRKDRAKCRTSIFFSFLLLYSPFSSCTLRSPLVLSFLLLYSTLLLLYSPFSSCTLLYYSLFPYHVQQHCHMWPCMLCYRFQCPLYSIQKWMSTSCSSRLQGNLRCFYCMVEDDQLWHIKKRDENNYHMKWYNKSFLTWTATGWLWCSILLWSCCTSYVQIKTTQ